MIQMCLPICVNEYKGQKILVALNMSAQSQTIGFDTGSTVKTLLSSGSLTHKNSDLKKLALEPYQSFVGEVND
jgi:hypothetical protein